MKLFFISICFLLFHNSKAQNSCGLRISLLTCAPGNELYSTFGHTALRVQDAGSGNDLVFNYGTFEFDNDFYVKFVRGKLLYYLSVQDMNSFVYQYQLESRSVTEQELHLSCIQKQQLFAALQINAREENKYYRYDFLFDNCTTRAKEMVKKNAGLQVVFQNILEKDPPSFRNLIHSYLDKGRAYWSKLGIDLLLGAKLDRKVTNEEAMFLPDYLMNGFDHAVVPSQPLVKSKQVLLAMPFIQGGSGVFTPMVLFTISLFVLVAASFSKNEKIGRAIKLFDVAFFFVLGFIGLLLLFMWFGTDHNVTQNNYNLLWAMPFHAIGAIFILKGSKFVAPYFRTISLLSILLILVWFFLPQQMNPAFIPIVLMIILRSWMIAKNSHAAERN